MKTRKQDQYDFSLASSSGQPGFEIFEDSSHKCWRFHGNDVESQAALFSQAYTSAESAQRGLQTTIRLLKKKRGRLEEVSSGWQLIVKSGNHQELARSRPLSSKSEAANLLQYFVNVASSDNPIIQAGNKFESNNSTVDATAQESENTAIRHAFRLYFYPNNETGHLQGRIENISEPTEQATFSGLDSGAILHFLQTQLNLVAHPNPKGETSTDASSNTLSASISPGAGYTSIVRRLPSQTLDLVLTTTEPLPATSENIVEKCSVSLRHMDSNSVTILSDISAQPSTDGQFNLQVDADNLPVGAYHLDASLWLQQSTSAQAPKTRLRVQGTGWIQLL